MIEDFSSSFSMGNLSFSIKLSIYKEKMWLSFIWLGRFWVHIFFIWDVFGVTKSGNNLLSRMTWWFMETSNKLKSGLFGYLLSIVGK